jgi:hypothetical protein
MLVGLAAMGIAAAGSAASLLGREIEQQATREDDEWRLRDNIERAIRASRR